jgi:voltage-gated potassium channel
MTEPVARHRRSAQRLVAGVSVRQAMLWIVAIAVTVSLVGALVMYLSDDQAFPSFGLSVWWAIVTVSTVGYGDVVPDTGAGRTVASGLILFSMAFFPILTGLVTASLVSRAQMAASEQEERDARERQHELLTLLRSLDERVAKLERDRD